ncbi:MAG: ATP-binding protein [Candidatus Fimadaptatus sp.]
MKQPVYKVRSSYVSPVIWGLTLCVVLLIGGLHTGMILLLNMFQVNGVLSTGIVLLYWLVIALAFTIFTRWQMKKAYEEPVRQIAEFASQIAKGDFSLYLPPNHSAERYDFLDMLILDLNRMVEDLGSIETLKTEFFSNVSHEIKTPLAVIQNTAELLQGEDMTSEQLQKVQTILQASRRLSSLITNILKLNKLERQTIVPQPERYDLCLQLSECALQFERVWEEKEIAFEAELDDRVTIRADESLMELVWTNLLSNAFKFTGRGGTVALRQTTEEDAVVVEVSDTGCGMSEETLRRIFDKFYQGDTSHSTEGNGLGLALVQRILQLMNCTIAVSSVPGAASTFTVRIPLESEPKES